MSAITAPPPMQQLPGRAILGPWADALLLGGASILVLLVLKLVALSPEGVGQLAVLMLVLTNFVNHPHFAHSYQMFYGSWGELRRGEMPSDLRRRWWLVGTVVPLALGLALLVAAWLWVNEQRLWLGLILNLMGMLVGWHYVKQGFGMAMTDAALKKRYWTAEARRALLLNGYACWAAAWILVNGSGLGARLWGVVGIKFAIPGFLTLGVCALAAATSAWCGIEVLRCVSQWRRQQVTWGAMPLAGILAYVVSLYLWTVFAGLDAAFVLVIPFFHSLQYLTVVWRYKSNEARGNGRGLASLWRFGFTGLVLGALGFWVLPGTLDYLRTGRVPNWTGDTALAVACVWIFINIHHYLIDNVLWRQGNPNVSRYLFKFGAKSGA